jgi:hypothetical protein
MYKQDYYTLHKNFEYLVLSYSYYKKQKYDEAYKYIKFIETKYKEISVKLLCMNILFESKKYNQLEIYIEQQINKNDNNWLIYYFYLGKLKYMQGNKKYYFDIISFISKFNNKLANKLKNEF